MIENTKVKSTSDMLDLDVLVSIPAHPKAILQIAHGMVEHKERYLPFAEFMSAHGYVVVINDHRGHGESLIGEEYGVIGDLSGRYIVRDLHDITVYIHNRFQDLPLYLFGHSMGSLIVRNYIQEYDDIDKLIICGTPNENPLASFGIIICDLMARVKSYRYRSSLVTSLALGHHDKKFAGDLKNRWLSKDEENVKRFNAEPKDGFTFTLEAYRNLFLLLKRTYAKDQKVLKPDLKILFIAGSSDPIIGGLVKWQKSISFMKGIGYSDIRSIAYKDLRHEILNEKENQKVFEDILSFCDQ